MILETTLFLVAMILDDVPFAKGSLEGKSLGRMWL